MFKREEIKLPLFSGKRKHILLQALERASEFGMSQSDVARTMNVTPQTLHIWKRRAEADRNFLLPAEQVPQLAKMSAIPPHYFRPDLWIYTDWRF